MLADAIGDVEGRRRDMWKGIAFAARYGSSPPSTILGRQLTTDELIDFNDALAEILREEKPTTTMATDG